MTIKVVCFDADGVVVSPQMQFKKYREREHGITPQMTDGFFNGVFNDCLVGKADLCEVLPPHLKEWRWDGSVEEFIETWLRLDHVIDARVMQAVQCLRENGILFCLATNQEHNRAEYMKTQMGFQAAFDRLFFSCEMGCQKPEQAYYQFIEKRLGVESGSILFWDDAPANVAAARELDWRAEVYSGFEDFERTMEKFELRFRDTIR